MRKQFVRTTEALMAGDERVVLLLGDIGVFGFRNAFQQFPERTYNVGVCEQAMTGMGAGLAKAGLIPILHTIAPFLVERSFEQLKVDFGYQSLPGNIISVGGSYDYAALGCTHHCPGDVGLLRNIPGMEIVTPGTPAEFDALLRATYANARPTYFRLSERSHREQVSVQFGSAAVLRRGTLGTVIAVGPNLSAVLEAAQGLDVSILYYSTLAPFDAETLKANCPSGDIMVVEPFYEGTLAPDILAAFGDRAVRVASIGVPRHFLTHYGTAEEQDRHCGLTAPQLQTRFKDFFHAKT